MSRRSTTRREPPRSEGVPTPIADLPHLAEAARRLGQTDRVICVDYPEPQSPVRTPGRRIGQWLASGELLTDRSGNAVAGAVARSDATRDGAER
ncbi:hypothetical protein [Nocardia takedensis]|uniref:hypothetical protein n=1 Tax=Nocardia takedensis TaxID=259390 RepID=UPI0002F913E4|nr:hypothetical protein [Nocardia takedensis]